MIVQEVIHTIRMNKDSENSAFVINVQKVSFHISTKTIRMLYFFQGTFENSIKIYMIPRNKYN